MNLLIQIVIVLLIVGLILGLINYLPTNVIPPFIKNIIYVLVIIFAILYFANLLLHFAY
jgi:hypothetical protein